MNTSRPILRMALLGAALSLPVGAGEPPPLTAGRAGGAQDRLLRMTDFLDTILPGTVGAKNLTLHFKPKWGDFRNREYIRLPFEARYGVTERIDVLGGLTPFGPNPLNSGRDRGWGLGEARAGARYDLGPALRLFDETTVGCEVRVPLGRPPLVLNDRYAHVKPFLSAEHRFDRWPHTRLYTNLSYDRSVVMRTRQVPPPEAVRHHIIEAVPGLLYQPAALGGFLEYRFRSIHDPTAHYRVHEARVGTIWEVPLERSAKWRLPGRWQLEVAYRHQFTAEWDREPASGVVARVTWRTTLRQMLGAANGAAGTPAR